jgi:hypothetical protein
MATPKINMFTRQKDLLNAYLLLGIQPGRWPQIPGLPLQWDSSDHSIVEFLEADADRTQIQILAVQPGDVTITVTDVLNSLTAQLDVTVIAPEPCTPDELKIQVLPLGRNSGDPLPGVVCITGGGGGGG